MESVDNEIDTFERQLKAVPIRALNISTRHQLSQYLNAEQVITTANGLARDYRGLAELMSLSYGVIRNMSRSSDPFICLLDIYQNRSEATFEHFVQMLEQIERFDIVDDVMPFMITDANNYLRNKSEVMPRVVFNGEDMSANVESMDDYDAYVCYADDDIEFVKQLSEYLESPAIGLRLFIRDRDMRLGTWLYESFLQLIESHCRRVLIILTPEFLSCPECDFQAKFAAGLAIEQRNRKLIPIVYKKCQLPSMIRMLTKIDLSAGKHNTPNWTWKRLVDSIRSDTILVNRVANAGNALPFNNYKALPEPTNSSIKSLIESSNSLITLPSITPMPTAPPFVNTQSIDSLMVSEIKQIETIDSVCDSGKDSKKITKKSWIQSIKNKFKVTS